LAIHQVFNEAYIGISPPGIGIRPDRIGEALVRIRRKASISMSGKSHGRVVLFRSARICFKRAAVALARKLAVVMHAMLKSGELFDKTAGASA